MPLRREVTQKCVFSPVCVALTNLTPCLPLCCVNLFFRLWRTWPRSVGALAPAGWRRTSSSVPTSRGPAWRELPRVPSTSTTDPCCLLFARLPADLKQSPPPRSWSWPTAADSKKDCPNSSIKDEWVLLLEKGWNGYESFFLYNYASFLLYK
jgi:hypothetical protein